MFAWRLDAARLISIDDVTRYGVTAAQLETVMTHCTLWATALKESGVARRDVVAVLGSVAVVRDACSS